jgi:hypothetical protein
VAVLTTSHLPALSKGEVYVAWARSREGWRSLGPVVIEGDGRSLLVAPLDGGPTFLDELLVTRESGRPLDTPRGPVLLQWQASGEEPH